MNNETALLKVLEELLEEIDNLDGIEFSRDLEPYKAEACWDYAVVRARALVRRIREAEDDRPQMPKELDSYLENLADSVGER